MLENTLGANSEPQKGGQPFETGYGTWAKYGQAPSAEDSDDNRREMFRNFAQDV